MTIEGIFENCKTKEELERSRNNIIASSSHIFEDDFFAKLRDAEIDKAFYDVCEERGWK